MNYKTIHRNSTPELVMKEILESIDSGQLKPGERLPPERALTKMFGVGRSTLREAISALVLVGYLEVVQGKGTFLKEGFQSVKLTEFELSDIHSAVNIMDLLEVREILECNAVRLAARRADANDVVPIKRALGEMKQTVDDVKRFAEHDFDFHIALARASHNVMILDMMKRIVKKVHKQYNRFRHKTLFAPDEAVATAERIVTSVEDGDENKAAGFMADHLNLVTTELKRMVPDAERIHYRRRE